MTKEMRARVNATIALALAALATASRSLATSLGALPQQWTADDRAARRDRAARHVVIDPSASCARDQPIVAAPEPPVIDDLARTGRFRRIARGTPVELRVFQPNLNQVGFGPTMPVDYEIERKHEPAGDSSSLSRHPRS